jgi:hypothetical protein
MATDEPVPAKLAKTSAVLFADLLGFASLTEKYDLELDRIKNAERPLSLSLDTFLSSPPPNQLTEVFTEFHYSLKWQIQIAQMKHPLTAITFSDSAFIATTYLFEAVNMAVDLVQSLLQQRIPLRVGIAHGSFAAVRFRSDITVDGGDHAAHFLGTGVVRSCATESCGIKGLRILLHPSAVSLLNDPAHNPQTSEGRIRYLECSAQESDNAVGVRYEIDYWRLKPTAEKGAWHALQDMWTVAPEMAVRHYEATAEAINKMRMGQGESALNKLHRRTLPRRRSHTS